MSDKIRDQVAKRFGAALRTARTSKGWTQPQLEERTGVSRPAIARYESGRRAPPLTEALLLANALGFSLDDLG